MLAMLLQLTAALWASVACAVIAYYGCRCNGGGAKRDDDDDQKTTRAAGPPGSARRLVFAALPAIFLLAASPTLFVDRERAAVLVTPVLGQLSLTTFKLLAFAAGRGPLARPALPPLEFIVWAVCPVLPPTHVENAAAAAKKGGGGDATAAPAGPPTAAEARALLLAAVPQALSAAFAGAVAGSADALGIPRPVKYWFYTLLLSQTVTCVWQLWRAGVASGFGLPPSARFPRLRTGAQFDAPWLSDGFAEYWGRRWNATTARALRALAYDPIVEGRLVAAAAKASEATETETNGKNQAEAEPPGGAATPAVAVVAQRPRAPARPGAGASPLRRFLALQATFALSGAWHALVIYAPNTGTWRGAWRWFLFFAMQGPVVAAEVAVVRLWTARWSLRLPPRPLRVLLTNALLIAAATPLFFGPCDTTGMCARMFDSTRRMVGLRA